MEGGASGLMSLLIRSRKPSSILTKSMQPGGWEEPEKHQREDVGEKERVGLDTRAVLEGIHASCRIGKGRNN